MSYGNIVSRNKEKGDKFENELVRYYQANGYEVRFTENFDHGVDLIIFKPKKKRHRIGIQAKNYNVGNLVKQEHILAMLPAKDTYALNELHLVTTSKLSTKAKSLALSYKVKVIEDFRFDLNLTSDIQRNDSQVMLPTRATELLRLERREIAERLGYDRLYMVFNNETMDELAWIQPKTKEEFIEVRGLGEKEFELFGEDILKIFSKKNFISKLLKR